MDSTDAISIEKLTAYSANDAAMIGKILPHLSSSFSGDPVPEQVLRDIIESPFHEQLVARKNTGEIVGIATVSLTFGAAVGRGVWLEDFVVAPEAQGSGTGSKLWDAAVTWCQDNSAEKLCFTSRPSRTSAQAFYIKRGAVARDTTFFKKQIPK